VAGSFTNQPPRSSEGEVRLRNFLLRALTALITFTFGTTGALLRNSLASRFAQQSLIISNQARSSRTYGRGLAGQATAGSFITLNSSDGMNFTKWSVNCDSSEAAALELATRLKSATIITREDMFTNEGRRVGEKVVAQFPISDGFGRSAILIWTDDHELFEVDASSIHDILEYRRDFHR